MPPRRDLQLRQLMRKAEKKPKQPKPKPKPALPKLITDVLPPELLAHVLVQLPMVEDVGCMDCVGHIFHGETTEASAPSVVQEALRLRAAAAGLVVPPLLPPTETSWTQFLAWNERQRRWSSGGGAVVAGGAQHAVFVDITGSLLSCGDDRAQTVGQVVKSSHIQL